MNLPVPVAEAMKALAEQHGLTFVDEISRACALWKYCWEQHATGGVVLIKDGQDGEISRILLDVMV